MPPAYRLCRRRSYGANVRQKKLKEHAQSLHAEQTNVLAVFEGNREHADIGAA